jgi:hypothetical protein
MAINNGFLKVGSITPTSVVGNRAWTAAFPGSLFKMGITPTNPGLIVVDNETTFFGGDSSNAAIKGKVYNDLRLEAVDFLTFITSNTFARNFIQGFSLNSTNYLPIAALANTAMTNPILVSQVKAPLTFTPIRSTPIYIYAPVKYDDSVKRGYLVYRGNNSRSDITLRFT